MKGRVMKMYKSEEDINELRSKIGGYITSNKNYKKKIESLTQELLDTKKALETALKNNEDFDAKNHEQINELYATIEGLRKSVKEKTEEILQIGIERDRAIKELEEYKELPWYKRIFLS